MHQQSSPFVLHIEDDPATLRAVTSVLGLLGAPAARGVTTERAASALVRAPHTLPCGFIVDHTLPFDGGGCPEPRGLDLAISLRRAIPRVPVALLTGALEHHFTALCAQAEILYLTKPAELQSALVPFVARVNRLASTVRWGDIDHFAEATGATDRELDVLRAAAGGLTRRATAERLGVTLPTLKSHTRHILRRAQLGSLAAVITAILRPIEPVSVRPSPRSVIIPGADSRHRTAR